MLSFSFLEKELMCFDDGIQCAIFGAIKTKRDCIPGN